MTMQDASFNNEILESLLVMDEGPTLDFKRGQYPFEKETAEVKSELLKDILAMVNTHRYRTAYILVGVEEVRGGRSNVVGVDRHWEDASLHQFVNWKTNRPAAFSYFPFNSDGKSIGVFSIPIQRRPVYLLAKCGKLNPKTVYVRDGSSTREATPDEIADMGRTNPPRLVEWSIDRLRNMARGAVETTAEQWLGHPGRKHEYDLIPDHLGYTEARACILLIVGKRHLDEAEFPTGIDSYGSLHWVFRSFERLSEYCTQTIRTIGPSLIESGALMRAIVEIESSINFEKRVWDEFWLRKGDELTPLPGQANYNLLSLAVKAVRFVDVLEDEDHYGDPDYDSWNRFPQITFWRSPEWGEWRR